MVNPLWLQRRRYLSRHSHGRGRNSDNEKGRNSKKTGGIHWGAVGRPSDGKCDREIKRRITLAKEAFSKKYMQLILINSSSRINMSTNFVP